MYVRKETIGCNTVLSRLVLTKAYTSAIDTDPLLRVCFFWKLFLGVLAFLKFS